MEYFNYYTAYIYNIYQFINFYNLKYNWLTIEEEKFYDGIKNKPYSKFELVENPWLNKYQSNCINLAKDIMQNGIYCPFFYQTINNKKYLIMGRHKFYSLLLYNSYYPIKRKFLFIEIPNSINQLQIIDYSKKLFYFSESQKYPSMRKINNQKIFFKIIHDTGDTLTFYLWKYNIKPFLGFNDEKYFHKWKNEEFNYDKFLCLD